MGAGLHDCTLDSASMLLPEPNFAQSIGSLILSSGFWRFFHKKQHDKYSEKLADFGRSALTSFKNISQYNDELKNTFNRQFSVIMYVNLQIG
jgi:hypothetical protein